MKTIQINRNSRELLRGYGATADISLNELLNKSMEVTQESPDDLTNISVKDETFERLMKYKLSPNESHADTIFRLLLMQNSH